MRIVTLAMAVLLLVPPLHLDAVNPDVAGPSEQVLELLTRGLGLHPLLARVPSVLLAMIVSWWINRTFTFAVRQPASLAEFLRFAAVASGSNITNYAVYSALLLSGLVSWPFIALVIASAFAMAFSYAGMRFAVFRAGERGCGFGVDDRIDEDGTPT